MISAKSEFGYQHTMKLMQDFEYRIDRRLRGVILELSQSVERIFHKPIIITSGVRTKEENEAAGGKSDSAHLIGYAVDIRSKIFNAGEIKWVQEYLKGIWGALIYVIYHKEHIHIEWTYREEKEE